MNNHGSYQWLVTADNSPSLKLGEDGEWMHSSGGAFAETRYIYGEAIERALFHNLNSFLSVGLGLGYNELLVLAEASRGSKKRLENLRVMSFEADGFLVESFLNWLQAPWAHTFDPQAKTVYDQMLECFESAFGKKLCSKLPGQLYDMYKSGQWQIHGALTSSTSISEKFHCVLYDAFSSKSTPELWSEDFLLRFLKIATDEACYFATYASTGALKRALIKTGFELHIRKGFHVKKESTLAMRL